MNLTNLHSNGIGGSKAIITGLMIWLTLLPGLCSAAPSAESDGPLFRVVYARDTLAGLSCVFPAREEKAADSTSEFTWLDLSRMGSQGTMTFSGTTRCDSQGAIISYDSAGTTSKGLLKVNLTWKEGNLTASAQVGQEKERNLHLKLGESLNLIMDNNLYSPAFSLFEKAAEKLEKPGEAINSQAFMPPFMKMKEIRTTRLSESCYSMNFGGQVVIGQGNQGAFNHIFFPMQATQISTVQASQFIMAAGLLKNIPARIRPALPWSQGPWKVSLSATLERPLESDLLSMTGFTHFGSTTATQVTGQWTCQRHTNNDFPNWPKQETGPELKKVLRDTTLGICAPATLSGEWGVFFNALSPTGSASEMTLWEMSVKTAEMVYSAAQKLGYEARITTGICILGMGSEADSAVPMNFVLLRPGAAIKDQIKATDGSWQIADPIFGLSRDRYLPLGRGQSSPPRISDLKITWFAPGQQENREIHFFSNEKGWQSMDLPPQRIPIPREITLFRHTLQGKDTLVGTSGYRIERVLDIARGLDRFTVDSAQFLSFGEMRSKKSSGKTDSYSSAMFFRATSSLDPLGRPREMEGKMRIPGKEDYVFTGLCATETSPAGVSFPAPFRTTLSIRNEKEVTLSSRGGEMMVNPMDPGLWRILLASLRSLDLPDGHLRLKTFNPLSDGKGYAVDLDLVTRLRTAEDNSTFREVLCPLYSMKFWISGSGQILRMENLRTRILALPCSEEEYVKASKFLSEAGNRSMDRGLLGN